MERLLAHNLGAFPATEATLAQHALSDSSNRIRKLTWGTLAEWRRQQRNGQGG